MRNEVPGQPAAVNSVVSASSLLRSTINDKNGIESGSSVSAASIGKLELKGISDKMRVMQLALSH